MASKAPHYLLPVNYDNFGETRVTALVRDPYCIFVYWEIARDQQTVLSLIVSRPWNEITLAVRVLAISSGREKIKDIPVREIKTGPGKANCYIDGIPPDGYYLIELGSYTDEGQFVAIGRSNSVKTPPDGVRRVKISPEQDTENSTFSKNIAPKHTRSKHNHFTQSVSSFILPGKGER